MNNLKRVLSLALASVMLIGMMAVGASATDVSEFSDGENITHVEAVDVMSTLGVIKGNTDGTYAPERIVKRGEMAAIITRVLNGGVEPTLGTSTSPLFTDVTTHWSRPYVEYCANLGIVNGMGDGTFHPEDPVTGAQAAKMLLVAAGYKSDIYGFTGSDWELNVNRIANQKGLYKELTLTTTSEGLSRDNAAQMSYNALDVHPIVASYSQDRKTGDVTEVYGEDTVNATVLAKYFGTVTFIGTFEGNNETGAAGTNKGEILVSGNREGVTETIPAHFPSDLDIANIGEQVKVIYKENTTTAGPGKDDTILGVFVTGESNTLTVTAGDIADNTAFDITAAANAGKLKVGDTVYNTTAATTTPVAAVINNFDSTDKIDVDSDGTASATLFTTREGAFQSLAVANSPDVVKFILDDNGALKTAYVTNYGVARVTNVAEKTVTLSGVGAIKLADNKVYEGIAKDDVVIYTRYYGTGKYLHTVTKAETVDGTVSTYNAGKSITVDGTAYKIAWGKTTLPTVTDNAVTSLSSGLLGEDVTLYTVDSKVVAISTEAETSDTLYGLIVDKGTGTLGSSLNPLLVTIMDTNGDKHNYTLKKNSVIAAGNEILIGDMVAYTASDDVVTISKIYDNGAASDNKVAATTDIYNATTKKVLYPASDGNNITTNIPVASANAVLFVVINAAKDQGTVAATDTFAVYKLRDLATLTASSVKVNAVVENGEALAVVAQLAAKPGTSTTTDTTVYGVVKEVVGTAKVSGTAYTQYTISTADGDKTIYSNTTLTAGKIVTYTETTNNVIASPTTIAAAGQWTAAAVQGYDATNLILSYYKSTQADADGLFHGFTGAASDASSATEGVANAVTVDKDVKIVYVDLNAKTIGTETGVNAFDVSTGYANVLFHTSNSGSNNGLVDVIVVETSAVYNLDGQAKAISTNFGAAAATTAKLVLTTGNADNVKLDAGLDSTTKTNFAVGDFTVAVADSESNNKSDAATLAAGTYTVTYTLPKNKAHKASTDLVLTFSVKGQGATTSTAVVVADNGTANDDYKITGGTVVTIPASKVTGNETNAPTIKFTFTVTPGYAKDTVTPVLTLTEVAAAS